jgi:hypothetical protein
MKSPRIQLAVAASLFALWIGWLVYLAITTVRPMVLSRPQFLVAQLYVVAELKEGTSSSEPSSEVVVREVLWTQDSEDRKLTEKPSLHIANLPKVSERFGWRGASAYILALTKKSEERGPTYQVTAIPRSPGYIPDPQAPALPIYRATPETLRQARDLVAEYRTQ